MGGDRLIKVSPLPVPKWWYEGVERSKLGGEGVGGSEGAFKGVLELSSWGIPGAVSLRRAALGFLTLCVCV